MSSFESISGLEWYEGESLNEIFWGELTFYSHALKKLLKLKSSLWFLFVLDAIVCMYLQL